MQAAPGAQAWSIINQISYVGCLMSYPVGVVSFHLIVWVVPVCHVSPPLGLRTVIAEEETPGLVTSAWQAVWVAKVLSPWYMYEPQNCFWEQLNIEESCHQRTLHDVTGYVGFVGLVLVTPQEELTFSRVVASNIPVTWASTLAWYCFSAVSVWEPKYPFVAKPLEMFGMSNPLCIRKV
jgi:hypothetical protein